MLSPNEIWRSSFKGKDNKTCPYCKNQDTDKIVDEVALNYFKAYYTQSNFEARTCTPCGATFSLFWDKQ